MMSDAITGSLDVESTPPQEVVLTEPEPYEIVVASPFSNYDFFTHKMRELCGQWGLRLFVVDDVWVKEFLQKLQTNEISVKVLFDLTANQILEDDAYVQLARVVKQQGGYVIDDPDTTASVAHKGHFHKVLSKNGIPVPETVIVQREDIADFRLTDDIRKEIGVPFVVKPAWGDSSVGVIVNATGELDLARSATLAPNSDAFLIQKLLHTKKLGNHSSWFRTFYVCGEVIPCWWDPVSHEYHLVRPTQVKKYKLQPLQRIVQRIARASGMKKFSSEICLHTNNKFYAVDYLNADPDMNPKSFYDNGVPDEVVRHIVWLLFHEAMRLVKKGKGAFDDVLNEAENGQNWLEQRQLEQRAQNGLNSK